MRPGKENVDIEYKRIYVPELRKDIVAFANTEGGKLYIGIDDDGTTVGIDDVDETMLKLYGKSYETCRSLNQELSFSFFQREMNARKLECGDAQMRTLGMIGEDGLYTNLALLLSEQCEHTLKIAVFQGMDDVIFRNHQELKGSLLSQLEAGYDFLDKNIAVKSTIDGLRRNEQRDYPLAAIREALLNALIHRDYSFNGSTLVNIYDDRIEFLSLGGLVPGLSMEAILMGVSQSRNSGLASIFFRLKLVESYGTGIKRMKALYKGNPCQPLFESAPGAFKTTLFNLNYDGGQHTISAYQPDVEKENVMNLVKRQGSITRKDVEKELGIGATKAYSILTGMCEAGFLIMKKAGNRTQYIPFKI